MMDQLIVWTFVHRELARKGYARRVSEDEFYGQDVGHPSRGWTLLSRLWQDPRRGR